MRGKTNYYLVRTSFKINFGAIHSKYYLVFSRPTPSMSSAVNTEFCRIYTMTFRPVARKKRNGHKEAMT